VFGMPVDPLSQLSQQQASHGHFDEHFTGLHFALMYLLSAEGADPPAKNVPLIFQPVG
jgi:hypothetical protein